MSKETSLKSKKGEKEKKKERKTMQAAKSSSHQFSNTILNSQSHIFLCKVKSHAGIAGNECVDVLAKYQACHCYSLPAETTIRTAGPGGNPFFDISRLAVEEVKQQGSGTEATPIAPQGLEGSTPWRTSYKVTRSKQGIIASPSLMCSNTAIAELTMGSDTPPTDSTDLRVTMQHKSGTA